MAAAAGATIPAAYAPQLSVVALTPLGATPVAGGHLRLTPAGCASSPRAGSPGSPGSPAAGSGVKPKACSGFQVSNAPDFPPARTNTAVFTPPRQPVIVNTLARGDQPVTLGTVTLTNGGLMQPTGAGMALVRIAASVRVATPGVSRPVTVPLSFQVMWSLGSPAPPNTAGLLVLVTRNPAPVVALKLAVAPGLPDAELRLRVAGFVPDGAAGAAVTPLGDWGQDAPAPGQPALRVAVQQGAGPQTVRLVGVLSPAV
ncbi:hypothetical protein HT031_005140 [Scenedesmus sp. PABB004]|nr:hypothetical protein HT031_005140 [Scenedesmus sp. PABB004]